MLGVLVGDLLDSVFAAVEDGRVRMGDEDGRVRGDHGEGAWLQGGAWCAAISLDAGWHRCLFSANLQQHSQTPVMAQG